MITTMVLPGMPGVEVGDVSFIQSDKLVTLSLMNKFTDCFSLHELKQLLCGWQNKTSSQLEREGGREGERELQTRIVVARS